MTSILITGTSRGIGLEIVRQCAKRGYRVFACCRNPATATGLNELMEGYSDLVSIHTLDVSDPTQIQALSYELGNEPIDILFNNAGRYGSMNHQFGNVDVMDWIETFRVNTIAPMKMAEAFVNNVAKSERKQIINITSKMGSITDNGSGSSYIYRSSKTALNAVMKSMSIDLKNRGIVCVNFHPGWVKTDMGGPHAEISVGECVTTMLKTLDHLSLDQSGSFLEIDGTPIPW